MTDKQPWTAAQHREFVAAVYEVGMLRSSPSLLLQHMTKANSKITTSERVKSHLQKYRRKQEKGKEDFLEAHDQWMSKVMTLTPQVQKARNEAMSLGATSHQITQATSELRDMLNPKSQASGEIGAYLSFAIMMEEKRDKFRASAPVKRKRPVSLFDDNHSDDFLKAPSNIRRYLSYDSVAFPILTEEEKQSSLGKGLIYVVKLLATMNDHLQTMRGKGKTTSLIFAAGLDSKSSTIDATDYDERHDMSLPPSLKRNKSSSSGESFSPEMSRILTAAITDTNHNFPSTLPMLEERFSSDEASRSVQEPGDRKVSARSNEGEDPSDRTYSITGESSQRASMPTYDYYAKRQRHHGENSRSEESFHNRHSFYMPGEGGHHGNHGHSSSLPSAGRGGAHYPSHESVYQQPHYHSIVPEHVLFDHNQRNDNLQYGQDSNKFDPRGHRSDRHKQPRHGFSPNPTWGAPPRTDERRQSPTYRHYSMKSDP